MKIVFVSNYINHHQIPFCDAMCQETGNQFAFIQTQPMEEERVRMGWQDQCLESYVHLFYEDPEWCRQMIRESDVVLFGGCDDESYIEERLQANKPVIRISERLYKTGQWKAVSPRGLLKKYHDHTRYRKAPVYLLCAGAYVPSDFHIIRAYPQKMFCWGYFTETKHYDVDKLLDNKGWQSGEWGTVENGIQMTNGDSGGKVPYILWAARLIPLKHPELPLRTAAYLKSKGLRFHMDIVGGGGMEQEVEKIRRDLQLEDCVTLAGFQKPSEVRARMERADIFLQTSDRNEGWGAVVNESMNSACAVVVDHMVGAGPYLIVDTENGFLYRDGNEQMLFEIVEELIGDRDLRREMGRKAYETITKVWNAENAAKRLMELIENVVLNRSGSGEMPVMQNPGGRFTPCAPAPVISERKMWDVIIKKEIDVIRERDDAFPLLSIIVPIYNIEEYLPRCVHSITAQTYRNLEILLVDDGSTDGTGALCDALAAEDARIRVFHKENGGSSSARNLAIAQAKGEYLGFVDSDDYISPDMYERLYNGIVQYGAKAAQVGRDEIDEQGNPLPSICEPPPSPVCIRDEDFMRELLMHRGDCSFCTKLIHRDLFEGRGFPEGKLNEDFYLLVHMLPDIGKVVSLPNQSYHVFYRIGSNSRRADKEDFSKVFADCVDNADMVSEIVEAHFPSLKKAALRFGVFQRLEYLLHIPISQMHRENSEYRAVVKWLRNHWGKGVRNSYLTGKNKCYHTLFAIAPKGIRVIHAKWKNKG